MSASALPTPRRAVRICLFASATVLFSAALVTAAVVERAPTVVLPLIVAVGIGLPMVAALELPAAIAVLRRARGGLRRRHLARLRRELRYLPETRHPLDL